MSEENKLPVALFNGTVATTNGIYAIDDIDVTTAKAYIEQLGYISAIGHAATAEIMSQLFDKEITYQRIEFHQKLGQVAIVFKLNERPSEGTILNKEQIERIGYSLKIMTRLA